MGRVFLGRYEPIRLLGEGGMGKVYLAKQTDLGRQVVVKVMHDHVAADAKFRERFQRETLLMARFQHPYVVTLYDASLNDPQGPCIVMEYIRGITLDALLQRNGRLTPARVGRLLYQLCEVLQAAHSAGIIHRDLKPANLMVVDPDTPYELLKVMDFGLAKLVSPGAPGQVAVTNAEFAVGTPGYMCPEQARGEEMDQRGDLYSVGVILYELLTGRLPFMGDSSMDVMLAHATEPPPPFATCGAGDVPAPLETVVLRCLAKEPAQRYPTARELATDFEGGLNGTSIEAPAPPKVQPQRRPRPAPQRTPDLVADRYVILHRLEAWMPESIAGYKLRGFVQDAGGEVIESAPGVIKVRLGGKGSTYTLSSRGSFAWLGIGRKCLIDLELVMERTDAHQSQLNITMILRPHDNQQPDETEWQAVAGKIFCDF